MPDNISIHPGSSEIKYNKRDVNNPDEIHEQEPVEEFLAVPLNTKLIATIDGQKLYTSDNLKIQFLRAMGKNKKIAPVLTSVAKLIKKGRLNICWKTRNPISFAFTKLFKDKKHQDQILGFYWPEKDKMYIMVDANVNLIGYATNSSLVELVLHEAMHMSADSMRMPFYKLFENELTAYYTSYFSTLFVTGKADIKKEVKLIYTYIAKEKFKSTSFNTYLKKYAELLYESFKPHTIDEAQFNNNLKDYMGLLIIYLRDPNAFMSVYYNHPNIMRPLYTSYNAIEKLPSKGVRFLAIQETISPDEVIAIWSEYTKNLSKIYKAFNSIK